MLTTICVSAIRDVVPGDIDVTTDPDVRVEGTGRTVVVVQHGGPWGVSTYNRANREVLHIAIHADASRNDFRERVKDDADQNAYAAYLLIDRLLHDQTHALVSLGFASCYRRSGPALTLIPEGDGACLLSCEYEVCW